MKSASKGHDGFCPPGRMLSICLLSGAAQGMWQERAKVGSWPAKVLHLLVGCSLRQGEKFGVADHVSWMPPDCRNQVM